MLQRTDAEDRVLGGSFMLLLIDLCLSGYWK
jgi:hypothetical protein